MYGWTRSSFLWQKTSKAVVQSSILGQVPGVFNKERKFLSFFLRKVVCEEGRSERKGDWGVGEGGVRQRWGGGLQMQGIENRAESLPDVFDRSISCGCPRRRNLRSSRA